MLKIVDLHVNIENKEILKGVNLNINPGELHIIMGPNGSGKSTLAHFLAGQSKYQITKGDVYYLNESIKEVSPEERACKGIFLSFQYPSAIPGINNMYFLKAAVNSIRKFNNKEEIDSSNFLRLVKEKLKEVQLDDSFIKRSVNEGFSGGEKKRNEILQMIMLDPKLVILDETDSGLDIDAIRTVSDGVNSLRSKERSFLIITHYQRLLDYIKPDFVHVLVDGKIAKTGCSELALELDKIGYEKMGAIR